MVEPHVLGPGPLAVEAVDQEQAPLDLVWQPGVLSQEVLQTENKIQVVLGVAEHAAVEELNPVLNGGPGVIEHLQGVEGGKSRLPCVKPDTGSRQRMDAGA